MPCLKRLVLSQQPDKCRKQRLYVFVPGFGLGSLVITSECAGPFNRAHSDRPSSRRRCSLWILVHARPLLSLRPSRDWERAPRREAPSPRRCESAKGAPHRRPSSPLKPAFSRLLLLPFHRRGCEPCCLP